MGRVDYPVYLGLPGPSYFEGYFPKMIFIVDFGCEEGITTEKIVQRYDNCIRYDIIKEN